MNPDRHASYRFSTQNDHHSSYHEITGVVLAGGQGTRLRPLTNYTNKQLLPIGQEPLISHSVKQLVNAQVTKIVVVIDETYASDFMRTLTDGKHLGAKSISYIWQPSGDTALPCVINKVAPHVTTNKIVIACGDILVENGIKEPIDNFLDQTSGARLTAVHVSDTAGYSPLDVADRRVIKIGRKDSDNHTPGLIDLGIYMYHADVFDRTSASTFQSK